MLQTLCASWIHAALDIFVVAFFFAFAFSRAKRGFIDCFFGFISTITAILVAFLLMKGLVRATNGLFGLETVMHNGCERAFLKFKGFGADVSAQGLSEALSGKLPKFLINAVVDSVGNSDLPAGTTLAAVVGQALGSLGVTVLAWVLLFFMTKFVLFLLRRFLTSIIEKLPIVDKLNLLLGMCVGILQGFLIVCGVVALLALIPSENVTAFFNECVILKFFYNDNPLHVILGWIMA